jgi:hypothetical protein
LLLLLVVAEDPVRAAAAAVAVCAAAEVAAGVFRHGTKLLLLPWLLLLLLLAAIDSAWLSPVSCLIGLTPVNVLEVLPAAAAACLILPCGCRRGCEAAGVGLPLRGRSIGTTAAVVAHDTRCCCCCCCCCCCIVANGVEAASTVPGLTSRSRYEPAAIPLLLSWKQQRPTPMDESAVAAAAAAAAADQPLGLLQASDARLRPHNKWLLHFRLVDDAEQERRAENSSTECRDKSLPVPVLLSMRPQ